MPRDDSGSAQRQRESGVATIERTKLKRPVRHKVLLHNDDFTTMEFVIDVLMRYFDKDDLEAFRIMLLVHLTGMGVGGVYLKEIAETKVAQVTEEARAQGFPLRLSMEPE